MTDSPIPADTPDPAQPAAAAASDQVDQAKRAKIVQVSTVHHVGDDRIFAKQSRTLATEGYAVVVYALDDGTTDEDGIRVVPVRARRTRAARMTFGVWGLFRRLLAEKADIYHLHDPELIPLGVALRWFGKTVVFDAHEDLPVQVLEKRWIPKMLRPSVARFSKSLLAVAGRSMSAIVTATPTIAERFHGTVVKVVANYPVTHDTPRVPYAERSRALVYVGAVTEIRGFSVLVETARRVHARTGAKLTVVGPFEPPSLQNRLNDAEVEKVVDYLGVLPRDEARQVMADSKVAVLAYRRTRAHENAMPNKLFEFLSCGVPVVGSDFPTWRSIIQDTGSGIVVPPDDAEVVADAVLDILEDEDTAEQMAEHGSRAATERFSWAAAAPTLLNLYDQLIRPRR